MKGSLHTDELMGAVVRARMEFAPSAESAIASSWTCPATRTAHRHRRGGQYRPRSRCESRHRPERDRSGACDGRRAGAGGDLKRHGDCDGGPPRRSKPRPCADGGARPDHGRDPRRAARARQRDQSGSGGDQEDCVPGRGAREHLVVPDLEAGNMLAKSLSFLAKADAAGIVLGARVPVILTSRADSLLSRLASCAVAVMIAAARRKAAAASIH